MPFDELRDRIRERRATVGVLGLGHAGAPLALAFARAGLSVVGYDADAERVAAFDGVERVHATTAPAPLSEADCALVCVPTPLGPHRTPDLSFVESAVRTLAPLLRAGRLVVLSSTTYPGTTREVVAPLLRAAGREPGSDTLLAYAPEREDPGRAEPPPRAVPRVVGGTCALSGEVATELFRLAYDTVHTVASAEVAEASKLFENVFRAVNIALVNELKVILDALGIDVWDVIEASATKPYGFMRFEPGPGLGGHCIPIDPYYLTWVARRAGESTRFIELAGEINTRMPEHVVRRTMIALNDRGRAVRGARVLVLGLAYKPNVADVRESPAVALIERLEELGAEVRFSDPHVPIAPRACGERIAGRASVGLTAEELAASDVVLVATAHAAFDWELVAERAALVVDTRGVLRERMAGSERYVAA